MDGLRMLSLHEPYPTLMAIGVKGLETRSWKAPRSAIGQRFGIHATAKVPPEGMTVGDATVERWLDNPTAPCLVWKDDHRRPWPLRPGHIVASGVLAACVPMVGADGCEDDTVHLCITSGRMLLHSRLDEPWPDGQTEHDISDQAPYGHYEPGRWAWLFVDVKPTTERCPACWGGTEMVTRTRPGHMAETIGPRGCWKCGGVGACPPIPAKGRQGIWRWSPT